MTTTASAPSVLLLLVEDDSALRSLLEIELIDQGFEVVLASSGAKAIAQLEKAGSGFKGVITDIRLGKGPDGWEVGHKAREIVANMPVIYMSGDSAHEWSANGVPASIMLQKPFVVAQLVTAISTLLNQAPDLRPNGSAATD
ncbi:MAG TPA: response regulator [Devosia sp.]|jgi:DNA-binding response OmpR family regulator|nr:response regulator [Devosia sp.]